jgi:hypothetical protein
VIVSPAGKEGIDLGNSHAMWHYDQEYNPEKMAQFTARVRRSDSVKTHNAVGRANTVRVESLHVPGTVEDFIFNAEDRKAENTEKIKKETRVAEKLPRYGDSASGLRTTNIARKPKKATAKNAKPLAVPKLSEDEEKALHQRYERIKELQEKGCNYQYVDKTLYYPN